MSTDIDDRKMLKEIRTELKKQADKTDAEFLQRYFKTGKGEYGEGDIFIGVRVPNIRKLARKYRNAPLTVPQQLLKSKIHEERLLALIMLVDKFNKADEANQKLIYEHYLENTQHINNWDLVDVSAGKILGQYLLNRNRQPLRKLLKSRNLWERRIAIMSTSYFINQDDFSDTLNFTEQLLADEEDLVHKAAGWMLREIGKRDRKTEERFLRQHYQNMPRTMLRYAIEKFPQTLRKRYLNGKI